MTAGKLVVGGILMVIFMMHSNSHAETCVDIELDKKQYSKGEHVKARLNFEGEIFVYDVVDWAVYKFEDDSWTIIADAMHQPYPRCKKSRIGLPKCEGFILWERPIWYKIESSDRLSSWIWDQTYITEEKIYKCLDEGRLDIKGDERVIDNKCYVYTQVSPGRYKMRAKYAFSIDENDLSNRDNVDIRYLEAEFTINR